MQNRNYLFSVSSCIAAFTYPSDGLIPKYSQVINGLSTGNVYEVKNANHIEVRNMSYLGPNGDNTKAEFNKIWSNRPENDFFLTPVR
jgi:hypothetical protein